MDIVKDWFVILLVAGAWCAATSFIFLHPDTANFITWGSVTVTMTGFYHAVTVHDSKTPDEPHAS